MHYESWLLNFPQKDQLAGTWMPCVTELPYGKYYVFIYGIIIIQNHVKYYTITLVEVWVMRHAYRNNKTIVVRLNVNRVVLFSVQLFPACWTLVKFLHSLFDAIVTE